MKLQVKSLREGGFCRLGVKWPAEGKVVDSTEYTDEQWERLMKEPNLKVGPASEEPAEEDGGSAEAQGETGGKPATTAKGNGGRKAAGAGA